MTVTSPAVHTVVKVGGGLLGRAGALDLTSAPRISVGGGSVVEGHMTRRFIRFVVTLSWPAPTNVTVNANNGGPVSSGVLLASAAADPITNLTIDGNTGGTAAKTCVPA